MRICLIRHGETDWARAGKLQGREDIPLNENGIRQSEEAAEYLRQFSWSAILSSPLSRARRTAEIIAKAVGIDAVIPDDCFIERDYGKASGLSMAERKRQYPDKQYEGLEDLPGLRKRMYDGLCTYAARFEGQNFMIVSHGGAINALLAVLSDDQIGSGKTRLKLAGMTMLRYENGRFSIEYCNQSAQELLSASAES